jgi:surfeit locus 1 family protein
MRESRPRAWPVVLASLIGIALLCSLGVWQVRRLAEKQAQIAAIDARLMMPAVSLAEVLTKIDAGEDVVYVKTTVQGRVVTQTPLLKLGTFQGGAGQHVIEVVLTDSQTALLVDWGMVPAGYNIAPRSNESVTVTGYLQAHDKGQGLFDGENAPDKNEWYWWDVPAMLGQAVVPADARVLNLVLHRLPDAAETAPPIAPLPKADLRNNHLGYAITWFGLAVALAVISGVYLMGQRNTSNSL